MAVNDKRKKGSGVAPAKGGKKDAEGHRSIPTFNITVTPTTEICLCDAQGKPLKRYYAVAVPQDCRSRRPGGMLPPSHSEFDVKETGHYGTPEWIAELVFRKDQALSKSDFDNARKFLGPRYTDKAAGTTGCGHMSKNVMVSCLAGSTDKWELNAYPDPFKLCNVLVAKVKPGSEYEAVQIWICPDEWDRNAPDVMGVVNEIKGRKTDSTCK